MTQTRSVSWFNLTSYRFPRTMAEACQRLAMSSERTTLFLLYQHYFPERWAASHADMRFRAGLAYSARELEFVHLVDEQLFPLSVSLYVGAAQRVAGIPIAYYGVIEEGLDPSWMAIGWIGIYLLRQLTWFLDDEDYVAYRDADAFAAWVGAEAATHLWPAFAQLTEQPIDWDTFVACCTERGAPYATVPLAIDYLNHAISNPFLEDEEERGQATWEAEWSQETCDDLHAAWQAYQELDTQLAVLRDWIAADASHMEEVVVLWNQSVPSQP
jgi:hypothetical protein